MGQYWYVGNVDKQSQLPSNGAKLAEIAWSNTPAELIRMILVPQIPVQRCAEGSVGLTAALNRNRDSVLTRFPREILDMVVQECAADIGSLFNLASTCTYLFRVASPLLRKVFIDSAGWAGDRLACVGDYAEGYPATISAEEVKAWTEHNCDDEEYVSHEDEAFRNRNPLYEMFCESQGPSSNNLLQSLGHKVGIEWLTRIVQMMNTSAIEEIFVRNITRKEFIRGRPTDKGIQRLGIALLSVILWTNDPSGTFGQCKGDWTAHHIDARASMPIECGEWTDITDHVFLGLDFGDFDCLSDNEGEDGDDWGQEGNGNYL